MHDYLQMPRFERRNRRSLNVRGLSALYKDPSFLFFTEGTPNHAHPCTTIHTHPKPMSMGGYGYGYGYPLLGYGIEACRKPTNESRHKASLVSQHVWIPTTRPTYRIGDDGSRGPQFLAFFPSLLRPPPLLSRPQQEMTL